MSQQKLRLHELHKEKGLHQRELAERMRVTLRQYQRYERGEQEVKLAGWIFLADFYNVSLDYSAGRSERRERQ